MTPAEKKLATLEQQDETKEVPRISMSDMETIIDSLPDESVVIVTVKD